MDANKNLDYKSYVHFCKLEYAKNTSCVQI